MNHVLAEFIGTLLLLLLGDGVVAGVILKDTKSENAGWIVINLGWGLAVAMAVYAVGSISGAHLNPAVTLALAYAGQFPWEEVPGYIIGQVLGAFAGAVLVYIHYNPHWARTRDAGTKLAVFCTGPAIRKTWSNVSSEIIGTAVLMFGIMALGGNEFSKGLNPLVVGLLVVSIGMSLGGTTGYAINPARDFGPRLAHWLLPIPGKGSSDWSYAWIPALAPILGGLTGVSVYMSLFKDDFTLIYLFVPLCALAVFALALMNERKSRVEGPGQTEMN